MGGAERPRAEAPTTPHTFLWVVSFAGIGLEVLLFAALGQRWPPLQPGPLSPLAATTVATLAAIVWSYGFWRGARLRGLHPFARAVARVIAISVVATALSAWLLVGQWTDDATVIIGCTLPPALAKGIAIALRRRSDAIVAARGTDPES